MHIQTLQLLVNQQLGPARQNKFDDQRTGKLGSTNTSGQERAFVAEVMSHVSNISLSDREVKALFKNVTNFELRQGAGKGQVILTGIRTGRLALIDAKILLDAAARQKCAPAVPTRAPPVPAPAHGRPAKPPAITPRECSPPVVPPAHRNTAKPPAITPRQCRPPVAPPAHRVQAPTAQLPSRAELKAFFDNNVQILANRPSDRTSVPALWPSASKPGAFGVSIPDKGMLHANSVDDARTLIHAYEDRQLIQQVEQRWGGKISVLSERPQAGYDHPAIWRSAGKAGALGLFIPGRSATRVDNLARAETLLAQAGYGTRTRLSDGDGISVWGTDLPPAMRSSLAKEHGITITPLVINGKEIAYLFGARSENNSTCLLSCHGYGVNQGTFDLPAGIEMDFAATRNNVLHSETLDFARHLMQDRVVFAYEDQIYDSPGRKATNYTLDGGIYTSPSDAAEFIGEMHRRGSARPFDFVLLNRQAQGVHLADLLQAFQDTFGQLPATLINHFCRRQDANAGIFYARNNYRASPARRQ
jgi:hypothetical protein